MAPTGGMDGLAFIDATNNYLGTDGSRLLVGKWTLMGSAWSFDPSSLIYIGFNPAPFVTGLIGSGTLNTRLSFSGMYGPLAASLPVAYEYSTANALAVSQADVSGTWSALGTSFTIGATGSLTGRYTDSGIASDCALTGTMVLAEPATQKNLLAVTLTSADFPGATCKVSGNLAGFASLTFKNAGSALVPSYVRTLTFLVVRSPTTAFMAGELTKN